MFSGYMIFISFSPDLKKWKHGLQPWSHQHFLSRKSFVDHKSTTGQRSCSFTFLEIHTLRSQWVESNRCGNRGCDCARGGFLDLASDCCLIKKHRHRGYSSTRNLRVPLELQCDTLEGTSTGKQGIIKYRLISQFRCNTHLKDLASALMLSQHVHGGAMNLSGRSLAKQKKNASTSCCNGWLIGISIRGYHNPY